MPAPNKIYIQVDLESKNAEQGVDEINKKIKEIGDNADKSSTKAAGGIKRISTTVEQSASSMDKLAQAISSLGIAEMGRQIFKVGDDLNRIRLGFANLEGGAALFRQIKNLAIETGMGFQELAQGAQDLVAAGTAPELVASKMQILADMAAKAGKGVQTVLNITEKMRLVGAKGFISGEDVGVFAQGNLRLLELIKARLGLSQQVLQQSMTRLYAPEVMRVALEESKKMSQGAAAQRTGESAGAAFGSMKARAEDLAQQLVQSLTPALVEVVKVMEPVVRLAGDAVKYFDRLPQPVKTAAVVFGLLAVSLQAVSTAIALWKLIPGGVNLIAGIATGARLAIPAITGMVNAIGMATQGLGALEVATIGFQTVLAPLLPQIAIFAAATAGLYYLYGKYIGEPQDAARVKETNDALADRRKLIQEAARAEEQVSKAGIKGIETPKGAFKIANPDDTEEIIKQNDALRTYIGTMKEALQGHAAMMQANEEAYKRATEYGATVLANAMKEYLKVGQETIAALTYAWKDHWKNTELSAKGTSDALIGYMIAVAAETRKQLESVRDAERKAAAESATMARKLAIGQLEAVPGIGGEGQYQIAEVAFQQRLEEINQIAAIEVKKADELRDKQIAGARTGAVEALAKARTPQEVITLLNQTSQRMSEINEANARTRAIQEIKIIEGTEEARIELAKRVNSVVYQMEKDARDAKTQAEIEELNQIRDYTVATITLVEAHTKQQKLEQIDATLQANLAAIDKIAAAQIRNIDAARDQFKRALDASTFTDEQKKAQLASYDALVRDPALQALQRQFNHDTQMQRVESWRAGNQVIIEEQRQVFESIAGVMGELFDAFLDKNKSVWSSIGDVIKRTILGALKSIVTSRLAASFAGMLGYGGVTFAQGPLGQQIPVFSGGGTPPFVPAGSAGGSSSGVTFGANRSSVMSNVVDVLTNELRNAPGKPTIPTAQSVSTGSSGIGSADRMMDDSGPVNDVSYTGGAGGATGGSRFKFDTAAIRDSFNIGKPVMATRDGVTKMIPWTQATRAERLRGMLKSPGFGAMAASVGLPMLMGSLQKKGVLAGISGIVGGGLAGYGLATMFGAYGPSGALAGIGIGLFAAGYKRRGVSGLAMTTLGGALAGAGIGNMIVPGVGAVVGAAIGAAVGVGVGVVNLFRKSKEQKVRELIRNAYGVDIVDASIRSQIVQIADQRFNGDVRMAVFSPEVQELVRLYALNTNQAAGLPRPMYGATFAQSAAGGLQLQPVYSGGRLVANPYVGTTTTQVANALEANPTFLQLNPQQAASLFSGQVVQVMGNNPGAVGAANTTAARSGQGRTAASSALLEPSTVMA